ncbi:MAG: hypothetical protein KJI71_01225 [Patescibacteria group bacterium]|nr:hypothetical protein [Patescibacteria group bacterium]
MVEPLLDRFEKIKDKQISEYTIEEVKTLLEILSNQSITLVSIPPIIEKIQDEIAGFRQNAAIRYVSKQHYDTKMMQLEEETKNLQKAVSTLSELLKELKTN